MIIRALYGMSKDLHLREEAFVKIREFKYTKFRASEGSLTFFFSGCIICGA